MPYTIYHIKTRIQTDAGLSAFYLFFSDTKYLPRYARMPPTTVLTRYPFAASLRATAMLRAPRSQYRISGIFWGRCCPGCSSPRGILTAFRMCISLNSSSERRSISQKLPSSMYQSSSFAEIVSSMISYTSQSDCLPGGGCSFSYFYQKLYSQSSCILCICKRRSFVHASRISGTLH